MYSKILIAIDLGNKDEQKKVLETGHCLAQAAKADIAVITVVPDYGMSIVGSFFEYGTQEKMIEATRVKLHQFVEEVLGAGAGIQHVVGLGSIYEEIIETGKKLGSDLIVMGAHRPRLHNYLLGPNAARVARHSTVSVHIVRG